jgi:DNA polymerase-3 subunit beta
MDVRVDRNEFLAEALPMQGIVERRTTIPVLAHLLLRAEGGRLHLAATDLDVSLTSWCQADVTADGAIAIQAKKFLEILRSLTGDEVHLVQDEPRELSIRAGASRFKIHGLPPEDFPTLPKVDEEYRVEIPFPELRRMIGKILFAVSSEESRFQLNGALLKLGDGGLELVATDGHRLALVEREIAGLARKGGKAGEDDGGKEDAVLVPRKALQELQRFESEEPVGYRRGEHHLSFRLGRRELICRILEGTFPDYERVIARDNDKDVAFDRRQLSDAVQRVALLTGDRARAVKLEFVSQQMAVSTANPDLGEAMEEVPCEYEGPEFRLGVNPDFLRDFLSAVETDKVRFEMKDENTQAVGFPVPADGEEGGDGAGHERYLCVIMPMRI